MTDLVAGNTAPGRSLRAVTPNDSLDLPAGACRALHIGGSGTIRLIAALDTEHVTITVAGGTLLPLYVRRVLATGTTATEILAIY